MPSAASPAATSSERACRSAYDIRLPSGSTNAVRGPNRAAAPRTAAARVTDPGGPRSGGRHLESSPCGPDRSARIVAMAELRWAPPRREDDTELAALLAAIEAVDVRGETYEL